MALKFDFNKLRTAISGFLTPNKFDGTAEAAGFESVHVPKMRYVDLGSGANLINIGQVHEVDGEAGNFAVANDDFFVFTANSTPGDRLSCVSTGTQWIVQAYVKDLSDSDFSTQATTIA